MENSLQADRQRHAPAIPVFRLQQRGAASSQAALVSAVAAGGVVAGVPWRTQMALQNPPVRSALWIAGALLQLGALNAQMAPADVFRHFWS